jgi:tRNA(Ile)-lysidine synthase TilS/MesJ
MWSGPLCRVSSRDSSRARKARYAFFEKARIAAGAGYVAVGHTQNDLAEDVVLRLVRGCGWPALGGMPAFDPDRNLVRPLLMTSRARIAAFLAETGVRTVEDASNADPAFRRNRVRHRVLPLLLAENPGSWTRCQIVAPGGDDRDSSGPIRPAEAHVRPRTAASCFPEAFKRPASAAACAFQVGTRRMGPKSLAATLLRSTGPSRPGAGDRLPVPRRQDGQGFRLGRSF